MEMDFEGKTCGECGKGKLHKFTDEISPGVYADAYKCSYAKHVSYSEKVMKAIEAMHRQDAAQRHVVKVGNSLAVPIPADMAKNLGLIARKKVFVSSHGGEINIKPSPA